MAMAEVGIPVRLEAAVNDPVVGIGSEYVRLYDANGNLRPLDWPRERLFVSTIVVSFSDPDTTIAGVQFIIDPDGTNVRGVSFPGFDFDPTNTKGTFQVNFEPAWACPVQSIVFHGTTPQAVNGVRLLAAYFGANLTGTGFIRYA